MNVTCLAYEAIQKCRLKKETLESYFSRVLNEQAAFCKTFYFGYAETEYFIHLVANEVYTTDVTSYIFTVLTVVPKETVNFVFRISDNTIKCFVI